MRGNALSPRQMPPEWEYGFIPRWKRQPNVLTDDDCANMLQSAVQNLISLRAYLAQNQTNWDNTSAAAQQAIQEVNDLNSHIEAP